MRPRRAVAAAPLLLERQCRHLNGLGTLQRPAQSPDMKLIEARWMDMETELWETWGGVGDMEVLEACLKAAGNLFHRNSWIA